MAGSFSLAEKIAVAGAFCALVAMAVGTEADPGVIVPGRDDTTRIVAPERAADPKHPVSYWSRSDATPVGRGGPAPVSSPEPEILPPGFGATPPPDLPQ